MMLRQMTDEAMAELATLLPPEMRGDYANGAAATGVTGGRWLQHL